MQSAMGDMVLDCEWRQYYQHHGIPEDGPRS